MGEQCRSLFTPSNANTGLHIHYQSIGERVTVTATKPYITDAETDGRVEEYPSDVSEDIAYPDWTTGTLLIRVIYFAKKIVMTSLLANLLLYGYTFLNLSKYTALILLLVIICNFWLSCGLSCFIPETSSMRNYVFVVSGFIIFGLGMGALTLLTGLLVRKSDVLTWSVIAGLITISTGCGLLTGFLGEYFKGQTLIMAQNKSHPLVTEGIYWSSHTVTILAVLLITIVNEKTLFEVGFGICTVTLFIALIILCSNSRRQHSVQIQRKRPLKIFMSVFREAKIVKETYQYSRRKFEDLHSKRIEPNHWLDYAMIKYCGTFEEDDVNDVKSCMKIVLILPALIPYWVVHAQVFSTFMYQGFHLDLDLMGIQLPTTLICLIGILLALFTFLLIEKAILKFIHSKGIQCPAVVKIVFGMVLASLSVFAAGCVELVARQQGNANGRFQQKIGYANFTAVHLSVFYQLPQYVLWGSSEIFVGVTALALINKSCSQRFQKLLLGYHYVIAAVGYLIATILIIVGWFPKEYYANDYFQMYFFLLGGAMSVGTLGFVAILPDHARKRNYVQPSLVNSEFGIDNERSETVL